MLDKAIAENIFDLNELIKDDKNDLYDAVWVRSLVKRIAESENKKIKQEKNILSEERIADLIKFLSEKYNLSINTSYTIIMDCFVHFEKSGIMKVK